MRDIRLDLATKTPIRPGQEKFLDVDDHAQALVGKDTPGRRQVVVRGLARAALRHDCEIILSASC
jgi:hypothetical protein